MDPKKALMEGLRSVSREEFIEVAKLFTNKYSGEKVNSSFDADKKLRDKYPAYDEVFQMVVRAAKEGPDKLAILHSIGMLSIFKILIHIAESKQ